MRSTKAIINLDAIEHNIRAIRSVLRDSKLMAIVKANAYGHGAVHIAKKALESGANCLGVALMEEAVELRKAGITAPILVIGALSPEDCADCVDYDVAATVYSKEQIRAMEQRAVCLGRQARAHLKLDTGFHRIGVQLSDISDILEAFHAASHVQFEGLFTHFASADMADDDFVIEQAAVFQQAHEYICKAGFEPFCHVCNSAASLRRNNLHKDMVRCGIILYGCVPSFDTPIPITLNPALSLVSTVVALRTVQKGETVGYGRIFRASSHCVVATVPIGYADGYSRMLSGKASVLIGGKRCPIVGRICMDQLMVDVSELNGVNIGDEVVLIGQQGGQTITADELGELQGSIGYEVLVRIATRVPREYV